jgi:hypothetical protein
VGHLLRTEGWKGAAVAKSVKEWSPELCKKVAKLIRLLGSDKDGEVLSAVQKLGRTLAKEGYDLHDLADLITAQSSEAKAPKAGRSALRPEQTAQPPHPKEADSFKEQTRRTWIRRVDACLKRDLGRTEAEYLRKRQSELAAGKSLGRKEAIHVMGICRGLGIR